MAVDLFEKCPVCKGRCQVPDPRGGRDPAYIECACCGSTGFVHTGLTMGQVERWTAWEMWLTGNPSLSAEDATKAEAYIRCHVAALDRAAVADQAGREKLLFTQWFYAMPVSWQEGMWAAIAGVSVFVGNFDAVGEKGGPVSVIFCPRDFARRIEDVLEGKVT